MKPCITKTGKCIYLAKDCFMHVKEDFKGNCIVSIAAKRAYQKAIEDLTNRKRGAIS